MVISNCLQVVIVADHFLRETGGGKRRRAIVNSYGVLEMIASRLANRFLRRHRQGSVIPMHEKAQFADSVDLPVLIADDKTVNDQAAYLMELVTPLKPSAPRSSKIAIKIEGRIILIDPAEVISAEAQGNYVLLMQTARSYLLRGSIAAVAEKLLPYGFIRIHRSVLLNASWVTEIQPYSTGEYLVRTRSGKEYTASRTYKKNLRSLTQTWIGSDTLFAE